MRKILALIVVLILAIGMAACASNSPGTPAPDAAGTGLQPPVSEVPDNYGAEGSVLPTQEENSLGITLTLENLTRTGAKIVCIQSGGENVNELNTGSYYILERLTESGWVEVEQRELGGELAWTAEAWLVNLSGTTTWDLNWEWLYGKLPDGHYRMGKEFMNFQAPGKYDHLMVYVEFSFGQMPISE